MVGAAGPWGRSEWVAGTVLVPVAVSGRSGTARVRAVRASGWVVWSCTDPAPREPPAERRRTAFAQSSPDAVPVECVVVVARAGGSARVDDPNCSVGRGVVRDD